MHSQGFTLMITCAILVRQALMALDAWSVNAVASGKSRKSQSDLKFSHIIASSYLLSHRSKKKRAHADLCLKCAVGQCSVR